MKDWFDIEGYSGLYQVSPDGEIRSVGRNIIMKKFVYKNGYYVVKLRNNGITKQLLVHRIVAKTFINKELNRSNVVNHIDGNKLNNNVSNLEWCTLGENTSKAWGMGLNDCRGSKNGRAILSEKDILEIRALYADGFTIKELLELYSISRNAMSYIVNNKTWKHLL